MDKVCIICGTNEMHKVSMTKPVGRNHLGDLGANWRTVLKWFHNRQGIC
jgi:hypothetical protein